MTKRSNLTNLAAIALIAGLTLISCQAPTASSAIDTVTLHSADSPLVSVRLMFRAGSIDDPAGKEGLAALTGLMLAQAGSANHSYAELVDLLYPMAASIDVDTDREVTVFTSTVHRENLDAFTDLLAEALLQPAFGEDDFSRNKEQLHAYLTSTMRATNDELLGLEAIQQTIFADHPYENSPSGTVQGLEAITTDDVKSFYSDNFTQANLMLGVAGGYPDGFVERLQGVLGALPAGVAAEPRELPAPAAVEGRRFTLIEKETGSVGLHLGFALPINRADPDYYPLMVANSYLGEHRTSFGTLMQQLRGKRGLNYGDYSYIEYWDNPPFTMNPRPNVPRRQQYFSIWLRPVVPDTAHFALRGALYELDRLIENGMSQEEFEITRDFVVNYSKLWARSLSNRLGFMMDSRFYEMDYYIDEIDKRLADMTVEDVNAAVAKYLQTDNLHAVLVTADAAAVQAYLEAGEPSPMEYNSDPGEAVLEGDKAIQIVDVNAASFEIVPVEEMFEE